MTWDLFHEGAIHIDHVVPLRMFDLTDDEQVASAWALSNLQPLWAKDNLAKAGSLTASQPHDSRAPGPSPPAGAYHGAQARGFRHFFGASIGTTTFGM